MRKVCIWFCRLGEIGIIFLAFQVEDFYANHLNFMRSVLYLSHQLELKAGPYCSFLALTFSLLAIGLFFRKRNKESLLLLLTTLLYLVWLFLMSFDQVKTYYLYLGLLVCLNFFQSCLALLKGRH
ncbi:hypothetical protein D3H64_01480 [Atopobacter sp. AH10]|uniref:hypothetical protein n=1 Tax=Atopobacter sp. AH10 TaxID=2315861 RepID=UPI000EF1EDCF|nr:hypothetical protein [Atopobacter sp. AH10]RLK64020.1 hypothetical protein D3H64_01480 [Atopobacter sp. AH10]